jgi:hypothetical protein
MHLQKSTLALLAVFCISVMVSPLQAQTRKNDKPPNQFTISVTALDALDSFDAPSAATTPVSNPAVATEKPEAPVPKIATDADQHRMIGLPLHPSGQPNDNSKRILGFIPNFQTTNDDSGNQPALTVKQKYALALNQTLDFSAHIGNLFQAAMQQAWNAQPHYGKGWGPYAERFAAAEGDQASSSFFMFGFLPSVLHDDPRYFRRAHGPKLMRLKYSATRTIVTRKDSGESTFNIPVVAGLLFQQSTSTIYYPPQDRTIGRVFQNWGTSLAFNSAYNVMKEFYPDVIRIMFHRRSPESSVSLPSH